MEIQNNNNVTNVNPQAESQAPQPGSKAKKKASSDAAEFDAAVMASLLSQQAQTAGSEVPVQAATKVDVSSEGLAEMRKAMLKVAGAMNQAQSAATANAAASGGESAQLSFPDAKTLIQTQAKQDAGGMMTEALVAGPNQPWSPNWVFGADKAEIAQNMEKSPGTSPLANLASELSRLTAGATKGGDAKSAAVANGTEAQALQKLDQELSAALGQLSGEISSQEGMASEAGPAPTNQSMNRVGGEAFLGLLQGGQGGGANGGGMNGGGSGNDGSGADQNSALARQAKAAIAASGSTLASPGAGGLHAMDGGKAKPALAAKDEGYLSPEMLGGANAFGQAGSEKVGPPPPTVLTGHVVPGSMMKDRLTSETVSNMTNTLSGISARGGNGEMHIRMNPGNLGELSIKVTTQGNLVGLKVQASDPQAKKILEESLSSLKDGLAQQNLSLTRIDISVAPASNAANSGDSQSNPNQHQANSGSMNFDGGSANSGQQGSEARSGGDSAPVDLRAAARARALSGMNAAQSSARNASGRLNVFA